MKEQQNENLFLALGEVGGDLVDLAERGTFRASAWRRWGALAACMALLIGLAAVTLPKLGIVMDAAPGAATEAAVLAAEPTERVRFRYTYYYLDDEILQNPSDLSTPMGVIEAAENASYIDCPVYVRAGATEYTNHSIHGLTVYQQIYVELPEGFVLATTYNEKSLSRYTYDDVEQAMETGDTQWLLESFAAPLIRYAADVTYDTPSLLTSEQLNRLFLASTQLNTGVDVSEQWLSADESQYVVPTADVTWRLDRFLTEYDYWPARTDAYAAQEEALIFPASALQQETPLYLALTDIGLDPENQWVVLMVTQYADEAQLEPLEIYTYTISFHADSWHYERIDKGS